METMPISWVIERLEQLKAESEEFYLHQGLRNCADTIALENAVELLKAFKAAPTIIESEGTE